MKKEGDMISNFTLEDQEGRSVSLSDFKGKKKVIYFYPKDDTPGCTKEACSFRDAYDRILEKGAVVIGISADSTASHARFMKKYTLPFVLLSDPERKVIDMFGAWGDKTMYGKTYKGIIRSTFILDDNDRVIKAFPRVSPEDHAEEVLKNL
ncbi:MAG TPA: thioredoxin-dependent thiol peroxidase [Spirochaetia bacterium]|nr:thioredoxin-dependent thiol peroxidase [Spirochaetia bacterium]